MFTGDDFNYAELIAGDAQGYSDALLGIFDAIAPAASAALGAFTRGDVAAFHDILAPTVPLSRHIFKAPTRFYKTGVVFMAYLNGLQNHFTMIGGQESTRSTLHLAELFRLADAAGLLADPELAAQRMQLVMATRGRRTDARSLQRPLAARDQLRDREAVDPGAARRRLRARRHHRRSRRGATSCRPRASRRPAT